MGYSSWSGDAYDHLKESYTSKSRDDIFKSNKSKSIHKTMDPNGLIFRESRDSAAHPNSIAISVWLDVTGSMGSIPENLIRHKLGSFMDTLLNHGVEDPHVLFGAIGDHISDRVPLQVGQFETGTDELNNCLSNIYMEGGGGGQCMESYLLAWLIAGRHTSIDCFEKRNKKGFLFTVGDEKSWDQVDFGRLKNIMGYAEGQKISDKEILAQAQRMYHVFHIHCNETGYRNSNTVLNYWRDLLGENLLILDDHEAIAELMASTVAVINGADLKKVAASFDKSTSKLITKTLSKMSTKVSTTKDHGILSL